MNSSHCVVQCLALLCLVQQADMARADPTIEILEDGTELVVQPMPGASMVSMRYVVHSGSAQDPEGLDGMAHLLEHLIFHGSYELSQRELFHLARDQGAYINAFTSRTCTVFALDARPAVLEKLAPIYIQAITSPVLSEAHIGVERAVVGAEGLLTQTRDSYWLIQKLLAPSLKTGRSVIGSTYSLMGIKREGLIAFYIENYRASNTSIVFAGDIDLPRAREIAVQYSRLGVDAEGRAPALPAQDEKLTTPIQGRARSRVFATVAGYLLSNDSAAVCEDLAALADLRLRTALQFEKPLAETVVAECLSLAKERLLVAIVVGRAVDAAEIETSVDRVYESLRTEQLTSAESSHILGRRRYQQASLQTRPAEMAEDLARRLVEAGPPGLRTNLPRWRGSQSLDGRALRALAAQSFIPERRVMIIGTPF